MATLGRRGLTTCKKLLSTGSLDYVHIRAFTSQKLPDLPYDYGALEPVISGPIMELHHSKHHAAYVNGLNAAFEKLDAATAKNDIAAIIALEPAIRFNGGGHVNHSIFWTNLAPPKDFTPPSGELLNAINEEFGSVDDLISKFNAASAGVQGSGWGWLAYHPTAKRLLITTTANQDPAATQYKNLRPEYLKNIWKVINWKNVAARYSAAKSA